MSEKTEPTNGVKAEEVPSNGVTEKQEDTTAAKAAAKAKQLHEQDSDGYVVDVDTEAAGSETGVKVAKDGHTRLIPQPSDDPNDPLNWSWGKKHLILFIISWASFLPDYGSATGAVTLIPQAVEWNTTPDTVNHSQAGNVFMLGAGGVVVVLLSAYFGRMPIVFWFLLASTATAAWCAAATSLDSFTAARILNGFFSTVSQAGGLMFIQDIFFFHERARKINIWSSFIIISPYAGPLLTAFMLDTQKWPIPFWVYFAMNVVAVFLVVGWLQETYYDRSIPVADQPARGSRIGRLIGMAQYKSRHLRNTFGQACWRTVSVLIKPIILISCFFYAFTFAWAVGINTTLSIFVTPLYGFGPKQIGFFYFTPIVAVILGEVIGHWVHDAFANYYIRTHKGHFEPEVRLRVIYLALPLVIVGLVLFGQAMEDAWHYMAAAVVWGLYVFGMMITTVALNSYCLDAYPEASGEVCAWLNFSRTVGGFIVSYFQVRWADAQGTKLSFGIQGAVCAAAVLLIVVLQVWGKRLRIWAGPLNFTTN